MSDSNLLASPPPTKKIKAAKKKVIALVLMLTNASITDVVLQNVMDKVSLEAIQVGGKALAMTAKCILGIDFERFKVDKIRMLCSMWNLKKYRSAARDELCLLIAQN
jgi:hypothetical protein